MNQRTPLNRTPVAAKTLLSTRDLERKSLEVVDARGVRDGCDFRIRFDGRWCIFDGEIDSPSTKTELFALVPEFDGALWIVDKLRTVSGRERKRSR